MTTYKTKSLFGLLVPEGKVSIHHGRESWEQAIDMVSETTESSHLQSKQEAEMMNREWPESLKP